MPAPPTDGSRQLWILRHAKAADAATGGRDRDRMLADRGRRDAAALGARLAADAPLLDTPGLIRPGMALCSAAVRTVQTAELVLAELAEVGTHVPLDAYRSLYEAGPDTVLTYLREVDEHARSVLVVGHNPTMFHLVWDLLAEGSADRDRLEAHGFPTCALAVVDLAVDGWEDAASGQGTLSGLFSPPY
jgi:phosphohistidine phosphatase